MDAQDPKLRQPTFFDYWVEDRVRFSDQDAGGHVNNTAIAQYVESGRVSYLRNRVPVRADGGRFVAANLTINYLHEAHYPGIIKTGTRAIRLGGKSMTLGFCVMKDDGPIACGTATMVYLVGPNTQSLPDDLRTALAADLPS